MSNERGQDSIHSGPVKLFEKRKSRHLWTERWAILESDSLRLFANHESFLKASEEPKLIQLTADTFCQSMHKSGQNFQLKIRSGDTFMFQCKSEPSRQEWLSKLGVVLSGFCRKNCFHCSDEHAHISIKSESECTDKSSQSSTDGLYSQPGEIIQSRHSTGCEDQITLNSPLKIYDTEQNIFSSFSKTEKARAESQTDALTVNVDLFQRSQSAIQLGQAMKNEKSPKSKNSFGYSLIEGDNTDSVTTSTSSLKLFDSEHKRFSTFSKRFSLKRPMSDFVNPNFVLEDENLTTELPEIPNRISKVYGEFLYYLYFRVFIIAILVLHGC
jgi:hypothetical protein